MKIKSIVILLLLGTVFSYATIQPFIGMRNSYYGFVGASIDNKWGGMIEHSIYPQHPEKQYFRGWIFSNYQLMDFMDIRYSAFSGMTYNESFYDFGVRADARLYLIGEHLQLFGIFQPFYDSFWGEEMGYLCSVQSMFAKEVGAFISFKNLPDYRRAEKRYSAGLLFRVKNLFVSPEISIPTGRDFRSERTTLYFIYTK